MPSTCASLLHHGDIDLGMIPSVEFLRGSESYRIVPDLAITSDGQVASVALFTRVSLGKIRRIGLDTSSRTSAALTRILCREAWSIEPEFVDVPPTVAAQVTGCDAALLIGDPALFLDEASGGLTKIDLGSEWTEMTGLPFVWAFWAGRSGALDVGGITALQQARDAGVANSDAIADQYCDAARAERCRAYLRDNIKYRLRDRDIAGLTSYYELAARHQLIDRAPAIEFF